MSGQLTNRFEQLKQYLAGLDGAVVAYSGGVDSSFLLSVAFEALGNRVLAVTATSETYPERERLEALELARQIGCRHRMVVSEELDIPEFKDNPRNRCYFCKKELFGKLKSIADEEKLQFVLDGTNTDDLGDHRPGRQAAAEIGVISPLEQFGFTKQEIRELSRQRGLPTWNKPAFACLSSRFPYGTAITPDRVKQVGQAEEGLRDLGFRVVRVRYHGDVARLELGNDEFLLAVGMLRDSVADIVKTAGFSYVSVDLQGYRTGSMNEMKLSI